MLIQLPTFNEYTVDVRLRQFRRVTVNGENHSIEFIDFDSDEGQELLEVFIDTLDLQNPEHIQLLEQISQ